MSDDSTRDEVYQVYDARGIGQALRHYRRRAGLTQVELAEQTAIPREYLVAMEGGLETQQIRRLFRLLRFLGLRLTIQPRKQ